MSPAVLWVIAVVIGVVGVIQLIQGQIILGFVLIILACLIGPGGNYAALRRR